MFEPQKRIVFNLKNFKHWRVLGLVLAVLGLIFSGGGLLTLFLSSHFQGDLIANQIGSGQVESSQTKPDDPSNFIVVDVSGAVVKPGIYKLDPEQRLAAAIELAGGFADQVSDDFISTTLNLSKRLTDEEKIHIYSDQEWLAIKSQSGNSNLDSNSSSNSSNSGGISINKATQSELESLSGIGQKRAEEIIQNRPFSQLDELVTKKILSANLFAEIENNIQL